jgi:nucleoside-diphosphate-sugar epimerase
MRAFITGMSGFVGGRLRDRLLTDGIACAGLSRRPPLALHEGAPWTCADCVDHEAVYAAIERFRPDVIVHCAMTSGHPHTPAANQEMLRTGVLGTASVVDAAVRYGRARLVHAGSFLVYAPSEAPLHESLPHGATTLRGVAKAGAELVVQQAVASRSLDALILRIFSVYGPGEPAYRFLPTLVRSLCDDTPMPLLPWPRRDFVHVDDVVSAMVMAMRVAAPSGSIFNVGSGTARSNAEVVGIAELVTGRRLRTTGASVESPVDSKLWVADLTRTTGVLGWSPTITLDQGLASWYRTGI